MRTIRRPRLLAAVCAAAMAAAVVLTATPAQAGSAEVTGIVADSETGEGIIGACVYVIDESDADTGAKGCVDDSGAYRISGLDAGTYRFRAEHAGYVTSWAYFSRSLEDADRIDVVDGETQSVDFSLRPTGTLTGTVTAEVSGAPLEGAVVTIDDFDTPFETTTDSAGHYELPSVPVADWYQVRFSHPSGSYLSEWYDDHRNRHDADQVTITADGPNIADAALAPASKIVGVVTDKDTGAPVEGACPVAFMEIDSPFDEVGAARCSDADGRYSVGDLDAGDYYVRVDVPDGTYADTYAPSFVDRTHATRFHVEDVTTVDVQLVPGAVVSGRFVESITGAPMPDVCLYAHTARGYGAGQSGDGCSDAEGRYQVQGLPPGLDLRLHIAPNDWSSPYVEQWYDNKPDLETATPVILSAATPRTIDAKIDLGGTITGIVRSSATASGVVSGVCVTTGFFHTRMGGTEPYPSACTGRDGRYRLEKVRPGRHKLQFYDLRNRFAWQFYPGAATPDAGTWVTVEPGETTSGINMNMVKGGTIVGVVRDPSGRPLEGICVDSYYASIERNVGGGGCTNAEGRFISRGFPTGEVKLLMSLEPDGFLEEWYEDESSWQTATAIQTTAGQSVSVEVTLAPE